MIEALAVSRARLLLWADEVAELLRRNDAYSTLPQRLRGEAAHLLQLEVAMQDLTAARHLGHDAALEANPED